MSRIADVHPDLQLIANYMAAAATCRACADELAPINRDERMRHRQLIYEAAAGLLYEKARVIAEEVGLNDDEEIAAELERILDGIPIQYDKEIP